MSDLNFAEAFRRFGAKLHNVQWSVCAENDDGELSSVAGTTPSARATTEQFGIPIIWIVGEDREMQSCADASIGHSDQGKRSAP